MLVQSSGSQTGDRDPLGVREEVPEGREDITYSKIFNAHASIGHNRHYFKS